MKKLVTKILFLAFIAIGCQENKQPNSDMAKINNSKLSRFELRCDYNDFKTKMTELDTIKISFNHSVCTYEGYERIEITKQAELIKIKSEFKDIENPEWHLVYSKNISTTDTIWKFGDFIERNKAKWTKKGENRRIIQISNKTDTIKMRTDGLVELNRFLTDYYSTMKELHPENKNNIYGNDIMVPE